LRIGILQLNLKVGDLDGNRKKILQAALQAGDRGAEVCVSSELAITGYPPRDLLLSEEFVRVSEETVQRLAAELKNGPPLIVGVPELNPETAGKRLYNSAFLVMDGEIVTRFRKNLLPTYDVFEEDRYFSAYHSVRVEKGTAAKLAVTICEDIWNDKDFWIHRRYQTDPLESLVGQEFDVIINLSSSPFVVGKHRVRTDMIAAIAKKYAKPVVYVNQVGGNDDLVFDGRSCVFSAHGFLIAQAHAFEEDVIVVDVASPLQGISIRGQLAEEEVYNALVLGTRDYVRKCGFQRVLLGLSGGIDSALTAAIAVEAMGAENVLGVMLPSPYSSGGSISDSEKLAANLGMKVIKIPIDDAMGAYKRMLGNAFAGLSEDVTEENIQSRIRGNILMALSNKHHALLLTTGNKSELAVGYCTIYGDMSGGLAVISDVWKTMVYKIALWLNRTKNVIPIEILQKPPSAELRPHQLDQDTLPPYDILDEILHYLIEEHKTTSELVDMGYSETVVEHVAILIQKSEFKRKQAAPGLKVTDRAFGTGWRMPIAATHYFQIKKRGSVLI